MMNASAHSMKTAVVVGGGPSGLATALMLSRRHGYYVTILEAAERTDVYDPTKAYPFLIRQRGQKLTEMFPDVQRELEVKGIRTNQTTSLVSIPADPKEIFDPTPKTIPTYIPQAKNFWLRRHEFIRLLLDAVVQEDKITLVNCAECQSVAPLSDSLIHVVAGSKKPGDASAASEVKTYEASLVVAADGMKSTVRETLNTSPTPFPGWKNNNPNGFTIKRWLSPASGLMFKVRASCQLVEKKNFPCQVYIFNIVTTSYSELTLEFPSWCSSWRRFHVSNTVRHSGFLHHP